MATATATSTAEDKATTTAARMAHSTDFIDIIPTMSSHVIYYSSGQNNSQRAEFGQPSDYRKILIKLY